MQFKKIILFDIISSILSLTPGLGSLGLVYKLNAYFTDHNCQLLILLLSILALPLLFILNVFIIRLILPKVSEGKFEMDLNPGFISWGLNLALGRSIRIFQLQELIYSSYVLKFLYWRAMGANIAFGINSSMYVNLVDLQLITVEKGATLGDEVQIGCHLMINNKIYLKKVSIGKDSFLGINCKVGPGTVIGDNCSIGPWNMFLKQKIEENTSVKPFQYFNNEKK